MNKRCAMYWPTTPCETCINWAIDTILLPFLSPLNHKCHKLLTIIFQENSVEDNFPHYPIDWSLKTKVRFLSQQSMSWANSMKSKEEAHGIKDFVTQTQASSLPEVRKSCIANIEPCTLQYFALFIVSVLLK